MADFTQAYQLTMGAEGGYANNPNDPGGETFMGIARNYNPNWSGWATIDAIKNTDPADLDEALDADADLLQEIMAFYETNYWDVNETGLINDQQIADQVFDTAVNCGTGTAAKFLQEAAGVNVDEQVGPITIGAVNSANAEDLYNQFIAYRKQYYLDIISRKPSMAVFENSWLSRLWPYETA
jgi:lysozyme family protein